MTNIHTLDQENGSMGSGKDAPAAIAAQQAAKAPHGGALACTCRVTLESIAQPTSGLRLDAVSSTLYPDSRKPFAAVVARPAPEG